jgi:hypothetical protein
VVCMSVYVCVGAPPVLRHVNVQQRVIVRVVVVVLVMVGYGHAQLAVHFCHRPTQESGRGQGRIHVS